MTGKLSGRTFGVQSLREVAISFVRIPWKRKAGAGGVAVALAVNDRIIPCCLFFELSNIKFLRSLDLAVLGLKLSV